MDVTLSHDLFTNKHGGNHSFQYCVNVHGSTIGLDNIDFIQGFTIACQWLNIGQCSIISEILRVSGNENKVLTYKKTPKIQVFFIIRI